MAARNPSSVPLPDCDSLLVEWPVEVVNYSTSMQSCSVRRNSSSVVALCLPISQRPILKSHITAFREIDPALSPYVYPTIHSVRITAYSEITAQCDGLKSPSRKLGANGTRCWVVGLESNHYLRISLVG